jgi:lysozyme family protein
LIKNQRNACVIVAWAWGSGVGTAVKLFQKNYALNQDGVIGTKTIAALETASFDRLCDIREQFYNNLVKNNPNQKVFLKGWLNRLNDFRKTFKN